MRSSHSDRNQLPIPRKSDFRTCLDGDYAWKNIGGRTVDEVFSIFCKHPLHYAEDFVHMGDIPFTYYFPVIDKFAREGALGNPFDDQDMATVIYILDCNTRACTLPRKLVPEVISLVKYLQDMVPEVATCDKEVRSFTNKLKLISNVLLTHER